jgi:hypothetical protein
MHTIKFHYLNPEMESRPKNLHSSEIYTNVTRSFIQGDAISFERSPYKKYVTKNLHLISKTAKPDL